ncbi:MAG: GNAT family N-acetyltransferase [bacterium]|nr:GNAT family N-acetyltransferase [bacterium]
MIVRPATADDLQRLVRLGQQLHRLHVGFAPWRFRVSDDDAFAAWFTDELAKEDVTLLVADVNGRVEAYARCESMERPVDLYGEGRKWLEIDQVSVDEDTRRRGLARALFVAAEDLARGHGIERLELNIWTRNDRARTTFTVLGYTTFMERLGRDLESVTAGD